MTNLIKHRKMKAGIPRKTFLFVALLCFLISTKLKAQMSTHAYAGTLVIHGDIDPVVDAFNFFGIGVSKHLTNKWLLNGSLGVGKAYGLNSEKSTIGTNGGFLVEAPYQVLGDRGWYPNFANNYLTLDLGVNYRQPIWTDKIHMLAGLGFGVSKSSRRINLFRGENNPYLFTALGESEEQIKSFIKSTHDVTYETAFNEGSNIVPHLSLQIGLQIKLTQSVFIHIEAKHHATQTDYLDATKYSALDVVSEDNDSATILTIGFTGYISPSNETSVILLDN